MPRSTRDRPAKAPLSHEAVVCAGLEILRTEGLEAVTMRRVATALDTGAASLYVYVANRDALVKAMQDRVTATVLLETPDPARWREQLHAFLGRSRAALAAFPGLAARVIAEVPSGPSSFRQLENALGLLMAGGMGPQDAAWTVDVLAMLVTYAAVEEDARRATDPELAAGITAAFAHLPPDAFPLVTTHAAAIVSGTRDERFRFAVDAVLDGVLARR